VKAVRRRIIRPAKKDAPPPKGVAAVDRALLIFQAFQANRTSIGLAELAEATGLNKATILRLAQSLIKARMLVRLVDGRYRIGSEALRLGTLYQESFNVADVLRPAMQRLADLSKESIVFHVREGETRVCLLRIESDQPIRYHIREGEVMPLELGSGGRVMLAFGGEPGEPYDTIRRDYHYISLGERAVDTAAVAAPVFGPGQTLIGSLGVSGPSNRIDAAFAIQIAPDLLAAAGKATHDFGGDSSVFDGPLAAAQERLRARRDGARMKQRAQNP
jgi:DNA-binding IclR family transcriptional regulator